jgi:excinuclease ABC subunit A
MTRATKEALAYYSRPSLMTDPGDLAHLLDGLPSSIVDLCAVVQSLLLHPFDTRLYDVELSSEQRKEINIRPAAEMLARIHAMDDRPLNVPRPPQERLVGVCRDFAVLLCTLLRHQGTPARVRVGFAAYFRPPMNYDHWVTEYWNEEKDRWALVEPQIGPEQRRALAIDFDPFDIPPDKFYIAGRAWQLCRTKQARSVFFGHTTRQRGFPYIRRSLLQDLAALNKVEVLPWDIWWELGQKPDEALTPADKQLLDHLADLTTGGDERFDRLRSAYEADLQFTQPAQSRLKLLGLVEGLPAGPAPVLHPSASSRLAAFTAASPDILDAGTAIRPDRPTAFPSRALKNSPLSGRRENLARFDPASIVVRGAQQHNLKHIDVTIPRYQLVVLTGVSGSGKSSLAFDTLYAEGQRRYVESLSAYVRRYMDQMDKPKVDYIGGLSPAIAIEQKSVSKNPRSTVGTITEVMDYLRVLYSRAGTQHCPGCGQAIEPLSPQQIADRLAALPARTRFQLCAPILRSRKGDASAALRQALKDGFSRARVDGELFDLTQGVPKLKKGERHAVDLIVDRLQAPDRHNQEDQVEFRARLIDSVETALRAGKGLLSVNFPSSELQEGEEALPGAEKDLLFSEHNTCPTCEISLPKLTASLFSFNSPTGMCPDCNGLGTRLEVDPALIVEHPELSLLDGASRWYGNLRKKKNNKYWLAQLHTIADHYGTDLELPWQDLPQKFRDVLLYGSGEEKLHFTFESENEDTSWKGESVRPVRGIIFHVNRLFRQTKSDYTRRWYVSFMSQQPCPTCLGTRLCVEARFVAVGGKTLPEVSAFTIEQAYDWVVSLVEGAAAGGNGQSATHPTPGSVLSSEQMEIVGEVLKELHDRLQFMLNVGLHYLTLDRPAPTLSGGEGQRIRLASQLGCGLVGVLYILDEPSIGLHARDQRNLLDTLLQLRDMGNTVLVVEHDPETMRAADWLIDLGPGAGVLGGEVVSAGTPEQVAADPRSLTGRYLCGDLRVTAPNLGKRRQPVGWLVVRGARLFNLKSIDARFPLGVLTCVTGVSGSGKSSLIAETLFPALTRDLHGAQTTPGPHDRIDGLEQLDKVIHITQEPIGRTPRSNPVTYVKVFDEIRRVFASTPEARLRGYKPDRFSFNVKGGRCEACQGHGQKKIEMHFLPDVWVTCQECKGARYNRHTLEILYKGKNIAEVLDMDVQQALQFFASHPAIARVLQTLHDVGLDYVKLGQSATTLSGGEAQRVKLAKELSRIATGRTIYILDEPTTGLHFADVQRLLDVLHRLVDAGNTVIVVEHNLDVIKTADWILDLGPEGGAAGGYIIAEGTPEQVASIQASYTGRFLQAMVQEG